MSHWTKSQRNFHRIAALTAALLLMSASLASAAGVDGLNVTFNPLPSADVATGLAPSSLTSLSGYTVSYNGVGPLSNQQSWGQTKPVHL